MATEKPNLKETLKRASEQDDNFLDLSYEDKSPEEKNSEPEKPTDTGVVSRGEPQQSVVKEKKSDGKKTNSVSLRESALSKGAKKVGYNVEISNDEYIILEGLVEKETLQQEKIIYNADIVAPRLEEYCKGSTIYSKDNIPQVSEKPKLIRLYLSLELNVLMKKFIRNLKSAGIDYVTQRSIILHNIQRLAEENKNLLSESKSSKFTIE